MMQMSKVEKDLCLIRTLVFKMMDFDQIDRRGENKDNRNKANKMFIHVYQQNNFSPKYVICVLQKLFNRNKSTQYT